MPWPSWPQFSRIDGRLGLQWDRFRTPRLDAFIRQAQAGCQVKPDGLSRLTSGRQGAADGAGGMPIDRKWFFIYLIEPMEAKKVSAH
jgi:hypothetical protein